MTIHYPLYTFVTLKYLIIFKKLLRVSSKGWMCSSQRGSVKSKVQVPSLAKSGDGRQGASIVELPKLTNSEVTENLLVLAA